MEHNIRIRRGLRSDQIVDLSDVQLQQLASTGVKNVVVTFGINDIAQTHLQDVHPDRLARSVADCVKDFVITARAYNISVVYVLSETEYVTFDTTLQNLLTADDIKYCDLGVIMKQSITSRSHRCLQQMGNISQMTSDDSYCGHTVDNNENVGHR